MATPNSSSDLNKKTKSFGITARKVPNPTNWFVGEDVNGVLSGSAEFTYDFTYQSKIADLYLPQRGEPHPYDNRLFAVDIKASYGGNNLCKVDVTYSGVSGIISTGTGVSAGVGSDLTWELNCPTSDEAIDTHPNFYRMGTIKPPGKNTYWKEYNPEDGELVVGVYNAKGIPQWNSDNVEVDNNQKFSAFKHNAANRAAWLVGVTAYRRPGATMRINFTSSSVANHKWIIENLGKYYDSIPFSRVRADVDTRFKGQTWLMTSASVQKFQNAYKYQVEFMLSGPKGWNPYIYSKGVHPGDSTGNYMLPGKPLNAQGNA